MPFHLRLGVLATIIVGALVGGLSCAPAAEPLSADQRAFLDIYQELVEINTTEFLRRHLERGRGHGGATARRRHSAADIKVLSSGPRKGNLVARLRGTGVRRPILLLAHIDVVEAKREDWDFDPFKLQEVDGYFRARGAIDDKAMASIFVANLIEYVKAGFKPERDIILALTTDEELSDSPHDGARWLLQHHRELIDAELAINEGGGGALRNGKPFRLSVQLAEKVYQTYQLEVTDRGGHSAPRVATTPSIGSPTPCSGSRNSIFRAAQRGDARLFRAHGRTETPPMAEAIKALLAGSTDAGALVPLTLAPTTTPRSAPPASPPCCKPATPRTRCRRPRAPP